MYDPETASLLRSAPGFKDLNPETLPKLLTRHFAKIVSMRLNDNVKDYDGKEWTLDKIADAYELLATLSENSSIKRSSAFVAGSAQLIISRREELLKKRIRHKSKISRNRLAPELSAVLLFLTSEQYADAHEAANKVKLKYGVKLSEVKLITSHIVNLAQGKLNKIIKSNTKRKVSENTNNRPNEFSAFKVMLNSIAIQIETLAKALIGDLGKDNQTETVIENLKKIQALSSSNSEIFGETRIEYSYPGVFHLTSLLISAVECLSSSALINIPAPHGADRKFWDSWLKYRAKKFPYIWPNHRKALRRKFHELGNSSFMVLPTGAGKTTISSLKIAATLANDQKVIFLAPTHALVEQLTVDLQEMFPKDLLGSSVSSDFDLLFQDDYKLPEIEVMTPERCLAMLSFSSDSFEQVGLLVFDECHLLSPQSANIRRSLDSMLCLLAFNKVVPNSDFLFLSAMVENGKEFSEWIKKLTGRNCISIDLLWKPSRQARGILFYYENELDKVKKKALLVQNDLDESLGKRASNLRAAASRELKVKPFVIWGLQHNWLNLEQKQAECTFTKLIDDEVSLTGSLNHHGLLIKPNVNSVASKIAAISAKKGLKVIVFVNQKSHAISVSKNISEALDIHITPTSEEEEYWSALSLELGGIEHSLLVKGSPAVPHHASMLKLERSISERVYKRGNGAMVIVATPTLSQGLNLPAQFAILAGDKRTEESNGKRKLLDAHEILNAAARAGRAGHLANGIVLLVPEPVLAIPENEMLGEEVVNKLRSLIPEDDRCIEISDPLEKVLDRISVGDNFDRDVRYLISRLSTLKHKADQDNNFFDLKKSFAAYTSEKRGEPEFFTQQLSKLTELVESEDVDEIDEYISILASQSGLPPHVLSNLKTKVESCVENLPDSIEEWLMWLIDWLKSDFETRDMLLYDVKRSILGSVGKNKDSKLANDDLDLLSPGLLAWIKGYPVNQIERKLGGDPDSNKQTIIVCPRSRELISSVIPRGFSYILSLVTRIVKEVDSFESQDDKSKDVVNFLSAALRLGFDQPEKVKYSLSKPEILSRVGVHKAYELVIKGNQP